MIENAQDIQNRAENFRKIKDVLRQWDSDTAKGYNEDNKSTYINKIKNLKKKISKYANKMGRSYEADGLYGHKNEEKHNKLQKGATRNTFWGQINQRRLECVKEHYQETLQNLQELEKMLKKDADLGNNILVNKLIIKFNQTILDHIQSWNDLSEYADDANRLYSCLLAKVGLKRYHLIEKSLYDRNCLNCVDDIKKNKISDKIIITCSWCNKDCKKIVDCKKIIKRIGRFIEENCRECECSIAAEYFKIEKDKEKELKDRLDNVQSDVSERFGILWLK